MVAYVKHNVPEINVGNTVLFYAEKEKQMAKNDMHLIIFKILKYLYGCNKAGKDIVCAAVSTLAQVLAESLKHCRGKKSGSQSWILKSTSLSLTAAAAMLAMHWTASTSKSRA